MEKLNSVVWIDYTNNPKEEGVYFNPHFILRRLLFREPDIIHVKLKPSRKTRKIKNDFPQIFSFGKNFP